jgi:hypothetical protein
MCRHTRQGVHLVCGHGYNGSSNVDVVLCPADPCTKWAHIPRSHPLPATLANLCAEPDLLVAAASTLRNEPDPYLATQVARMLSEYGSGTCRCDTMLCVC